MQQTTVAMDQAASDVKEAEADMDKVDGASGKLKSAMEAPIELAWPMCCLSL